MEQNRKEIRRALIMCVPYLLIIFFLENIDKFLYSVHSRLGNPLLVLYMLISTVIIFALLINGILSFKDNYKEAGRSVFLPLFMYAIALINSFWSPLRVSSEIFQPRIVHRAYRLEHYGHAQMKMRENGSLNIRYPGPFGMADWEYGRWSGRGDTFYLHYDQGADSTLAKPDTLILTSDGLLKPLGIPDDTLNMYKNRFFRIQKKRK